MGGLTTPLIMPVGVIIAGGQSRRFQGSSQNFSTHKDSGHKDKFLMNFGSGTVLSHIVDRAKQQISPLWLNINGDLGRVSSYDIDAFSDEHDTVGPLAGILAAMKKAKARGFSHIVTFSGDSPFFPDDYVARMVSALGGDSIKLAIAYTTNEHITDKGKDRPHPVMGIFAVDLQNDLEAYIHQGERRVMGWVRQQEYGKIVWDKIEPDPFFNINHPKDLTEAERYLAKD